MWGNVRLRRDTSVCEAPGLKPFSLVSERPVTDHLIMIAGKATFSACLVTALVGCGEGYRLDPATFNVNDITDESKTKLLDTGSRSLKAEGFEDFGRYDEMIALIRQNRAMSPAASDEELARLNRERTFLNDAHHLRVVLADHSNGLPTEPFRPGYKPLSDHFVELNIYEERPGGFSPDGVRFYNRFLSDLQKAFGTAVVVVKTPPPTDDAEYQRITRANTVGAIVGWLIAVSAALLFTGSLSVYLLRRLKLPIAVRRLIFVLVNAWLIAPLPFQGGFIFVFPGPNLLAFPWTDIDYYEQVATHARLSFPCALVLCAFASLLLFRSRPLVANGVVV
jgi:hypothetical protein